MAQRSPDQIADILTRGVSSVLVKEHLQKRLASGSKLRIKLGIDPTRPKLHIGHAILLLKLRALQELGHKVVLIIGDFTAQIGDPSDKEGERPMLTEDQVISNMKRYQEQAGRLIDLDKAEVRYNGEWHNNLTQKQMLVLASQFTVSQMIERENFAKRLKAGKGVWLHELFYPVLQAYDSVMVKADLELGGNDQLFNLLAGRELQRFYKQEPQDTMTVELLTGTDGRKMSASYDNAIWLDDSATEMYGKVMSLDDKLIISYFRLCTTVPASEIKAIERSFKAGANPRDVKARLAEALTTLYHGAAKATAAAESFARVFRQGSTPDDLPVVRLGATAQTLVDIIIKAKLARSRSEARRLIEQGAVSIDQQTQRDWQTTVKLKKGAIIQVGKRRFVQIA